MTQKKRKLIVKYGSKCVVTDAGLDEIRINDYVTKLVSLQKAYDVQVVSSGSVAFGRRIVQETGQNSDQYDQQVLAGLGSAGLAEIWRQAFARHGVLAAQVLITHHEIDDHSEGSNLLKAITKNTDHKVVSICNENDLLSDKELKKLAYGGDNDGLASHLAARLQADILLLLSDVDGFMQAGMVRPQVRAKDIKSLAQHLNHANKDGTGSMASKLEAAAAATAEGITAYIGNADADYRDILAGKSGTQVIL